MTNFIRLAVFFCLVGASSVWADVREINGDKGRINWNVVTTDKGCIAYLYNAFNKNQVSITWSGNCQNGQLISGNGTLTELFSRFSKKKEVSWTGQFVSGFLSGSVTFHQDGYTATDEYEMGCVQLREREYPRCKSKRPSQAEGPTTLGDDPKVLGGRYKP